MSCKHGRRTARGRRPAQVRAPGFGTSPRRSKSHRSVSFTGFAYPSRLAPKNSILLTALLTVLELRVTQNRSNCGTIQYIREYLGELQQCDLGAVLRQRKHKRPCTRTFRPHTFSDWSLWDGKEVESRTQKKEGIIEHQFLKIPVLSGVVVTNISDFEND
uniref:Uncharacterized protein n=1 Tax=Timema cristinae TaxID=61476 RepID=A0A7R9D8T4_TIMCR|nr:unnamed protein product [Timema cristinae]